MGTLGELVSGVGGKYFFSRRQETSKFGAVDLQEALYTSGVGFHLTYKCLDAGDVGMTKTVYLRGIERSDALYGNNLSFMRCHVNSLAQRSREDGSCE